MSNSPQEKENSYQAWAFQEEPYPAEAAPAPGYRPGGLTAICIIAIVLAALGLFTGCSGLTMAMFGNQIQQWQQQFGAAGAPPEAVKVQAEMNLQTIRIFNRFRVINVILSVCQLMIVGALFVGAIQTLRSRESGRRLLWIACVAALGWELARVVPYTLMQAENSALMEEYMPRLMEAQTREAQSAQMAEFGRMFARFSAIMGWVIFVGWLMLKLVYFGVAVRYLNRPRIRALFQTA